MRHRVKNLLVYSHDGYGLGNIRRMLEITNHLVETDPDVTVLLVSGSPVVQALRMSPRIDYVKLPCIGRGETGETIVRSLNISSGDTIGLRADIITTAVLGFDPDVVLVDKKPFGLYDELKPAFATLREAGRRPRAMLLLRDILDAPEATMREWERNGYHDAIAAFYDSVLIVGTEEIFDAARAYRFPASTREKVRYCGYIRRPAPARSRADVRAELGFGDAPIVLVTAGGGGDGYALMKAYLEGVARTAGAAFRTLLVSGPEMSPANRRQLVDLASRCGGVTVTEFTPDMVSYMNAADLVVSMGGYNTVCELLSLRKNAIVVPRVRPVQEQWMRAERMQAMGLLRAIHPDALTSDGLIAAVQEELRAPGRVREALARFEMDGLPRIERAIAGVAPRVIERDGATVAAVVEQG